MRAGALCHRIRAASPVLGAGPDTERVLKKYFLNRMDGRIAE